MHKVNIRARKDRKLSKLFANTNHYATWDDHDYGPNNSDRLYSGKFRSLEIFKNYWPNPSFGTKETPGVFFSFTKSDASFFVLDTRFYAEKDVQMLGDSQMEWLKKGTYRQDVDRVMYFKVRLFPTEISCTVIDYDSNAR